MRKIEPLYSWSEKSPDGIRWEAKPTNEQIINKLNEVIDAVNKLIAQQKGV